MSVTESRPIKVSHCALLCHPLDGGRGSTQEATAVTFSSTKVQHDAPSETVWLSVDSL